MSDPLLVSSKVPLVSVSLADAGDSRHTRVSYYVNNVMVMDMDILKELVPLANADPMVLTQLLVTPHEHLAVLADVFALAQAKECSGPRWDSVVSRIGLLLGAPAPVPALV